MPETDLSNVINLYPNSRRAFLKCWFANVHSMLTTGISGSQLMPFKVTNINQ